MTKDELIKYLKACKEEAQRFADNCRTMTNAPVTAYYDGRVDGLDHAIAMLEGLKETK